MKLDFIFCHYRRRLHAPTAPVRAATSTLEKVEAGNTTVHSLTRAKVTKQGPKEKLKAARAFCPSFSLDETTQTWTHMGVVCASTTRQVSVQMLQTAVSAEGAGTYVVERIASHRTQRKNMTQRRSDGGTASVL